MTNTNLVQHSNDFLDQWFFLTAIVVEKWNIYISRQNFQWQNPDLAPDNFSHVTRLLIFFPFRFSDTHVYVWTTKGRETKERVG